jgi:uncharacterized protein
MSELAPVSARERLLTLDVLRGFALLGVLIGNLFWLYSGRAWLPDGAPPHGIDKAALWFVLIAVDSKAQTLLCMLFGFGFAMQLLRAERRREDVMPVYLRRMLVLFAIGALHVTLIWWGDVTWTYAVAGFGLLLFQRSTNRTRLVAAAVLIFVPYLVWSVPAVREATTHLFADQATLQRLTHAYVDTMRRGSYPMTIAAHVQFALVWETRIYSWYFFWLLGRFLVGYAAGRARLFDGDGAAHLPLFKRILVGGAAITALSTTLTAIGTHPHSVPARLAFVFIEQAGLLGQTALYVSLVVLLVQRPRWRKALAILAPVGRMPLTVYISQSIVSTTIFYGWGLGQAGRLSPAECLGLAVGIFAAQTAACHVYLRRWRFGPLEYVWRRLVYLRPLAAP